MAADAALLSFRDLRDRFRCEQPTLLKALCRAGVPILRGPNNAGWVRTEDVARLGRVKVRKQRRHWGGERRVEDADA